MSGRTMGQWTPVAGVAALAIALSVGWGPARAARIKDVAFVDGVRPNQLVGYGLVSGLSGTGDNERAVFMVQSVTAMLSRFGVRIDPRELILRNVAAVSVTATLPPWRR